jgi:peptidoglycan/LPS O-acetylase OafA/YrhL
MGENAERKGAPVSAREHIPVLDGLRGVAILLVICFHFWQQFPHDTDSFFSKVAVWGQTGVDLFFVLSGFLITGILLDAKGSSHFLRNFYLRRMFRIFPLYYATLFAFYVLGPLLRLSKWTPWKQALWYLVFLQNIPATFAPGMASGPGHFWSLAVEEHYYLVWPFLVLLFASDKLLKVTGLAVGVSVLTRIVLIRDGAPLYTLAALDGLAVGSALAILARSRDGGLARFAGPAMPLLCSLWPALIVTYWLVGGKGLPAIQVVKASLIAVTYGCVLILALERRLGRRLEVLLSGPVLGSVGKYSYGMYVFHPFIIGGLRDRGLAYGVPAFAASIALSYVAAWISWTLFESRFLRLKDHFAHASNGETRSTFLAAATAGGR